MSNEPSCIIETETLNNIRVIKSNDINNISQLFQDRNTYINGRETIKRIDFSTFSYNERKERRKREVLKNKKNSINLRNKQINSKLKKIRNICLNNDNIPFEERL